MQPEEYVYPARKEPLLEAYGGRFEAAYIVLHPFVGVPEEWSWHGRRQYPSDPEIRARGRKFRWAEAARGAGIRNCAQLSQALLSSIGALEDFLCDAAAAEALAGYLRRESVWMPTEGRFEPLLEADFLAAFRLAGAEELVHVPEFPGQEPTRRIALAALEQDRESFPAGGTLLAPDESFLAAVDWDSFFTLLYGRREFLARVARERGLEGFFAEKETEHFWFQWKMGCATCTVSPEGWAADAGGPCACGTMRATDKAAGNRRG